MRRRDPEQVWGGLLRRFGIPLDSVPTLAMASPAELVPNAPSVYLDTNHWIGLAKARLGRPDAQRVRPCYEGLLDQVLAGNVRVVLSAASYIEVARSVRSVRQRTDLADVMSEITRFRTIRRISHLLESQFALALHHRLGRPSFPERVQVFGIGCSFALGGSEGPIMEMVGETPPGLTLADLFGGAEAFADIMFRINEITEYLLLRGPGEEEASRPPEYNLAIRGMAAIEQEQVRREAELAQLLAADPTLKRRLDEIVAARELYFELGPPLRRLLWKAGLTVEGFFGKGNDWVRDFLESLPSFAVQKALKRRAFANGSRDWSVNDLRDVDHMGIAVPYCDIVITERHAASILRQEHLDERFETVVLTDLVDLPDVVEAHLRTSSSGIPNK